MNIKHFLPLLGIALLTACSDEEHAGTGQANENANPALFPEAGHLEIPRIDNETGNIYVHYATTEQGGRLLNYALDWHADKKHSRWVAFVFTNTTATTHWNRNKWNGAYWDGQYWEGDPFQPDPDIPAGERTELADFRGSGYDRGHLCPAADNKWDARAMKESFYMSNISPQLPGLNRGSWKKLEDRCRRWAAAGGTYYIVAGPVFSDAPAKHIGTGRVAVPGGFFKVIYTDVGGKPRAAGFLFDNVEGKTAGERIVTVDAVERLTRYDFFPNLPDATEKKVEATVNAALWR